MIEYPKKDTFFNEKTFLDNTYLFSENCSFIDCVFGANCILPPGSYYEECTFGDGCVILNA